MTDLTLQAGNGFARPANRSAANSLRVGGILARCVLLVSLILISCLTAFGAPIVEISFSDDQTTITVGDAPEHEVIAIGKSVIVGKNAKGVLAIGGDVTVEGHVEGDVATIGGNVIQKEGAYIGGDIIVFGGAYKPEGENPLRAEGKETITFGVFEEELRTLGQNPSQFFAPNFTIGFLAQRLLLVLFWFVLSMIFTTIAPGAVSRAVARIHLSLLKVCALGATTVLLMIGIIIAGALTLPEHLSVTLGLMSTVILMMGYVFGRVALQVSVGKMLQRRFLPENNRSETLAILIGVLVWTAVLSLPYFWVLALFAIFAVGIGLVLTGRSTPTWQHQ